MAANRYNTGLNYNIGASAVINLVKSKTMGLLPMILEVILSTMPIMLLEQPIKKIAVVLR